MKKLAEFVVKKTDKRIVKKRMKKDAKVVKDIDKKED